METKTLKIATNLFSSNPCSVRSVFFQYLKIFLKVYCIILSLTIVSSAKDLKIEMIKYADKKNFLLLPLGIYFVLFQCGNYC